MPASAAVASPSRIVRWWHAGPLGEFFIKAARPIGRAIAAVLVFPYRQRMVDGCAGDPAFVDKGTLESVTRTVAVGRAGAAAARDLASWCGAQPLDDPARRRGHSPVRRLGLRLERLQ
ncbi:hypothetical protein [Nannocystis pusilla]|uniref:Uncharacterized protein n=1 Tax=Nannocystis pusilla TaxID=889268 RepID=A0ABS7TRU8_9BACT|nr:hypothetical protein [Nannocystis pusilla]MBZ5710905.1 hypothetical protein [Nannocystis pusilla]